MSHPNWYDEGRQLLAEIDAALDECVDLHPTYEAVSLYVQDAVRRINRADRDAPLFHHGASRRALFGLEVLLRETPFPDRSSGSWVARADELAEFNSRHGVIHNYRFVLDPRWDDVAIDVTSAHHWGHAIESACEADLPTPGSVMLGPVTLGAVVSMAVLTLRYRGVRVSSGVLPAAVGLRERLVLVAGNPNAPELEAITEIAQDTSLTAAQRVKAVEMWLLTGQV